MHFYLLADLIKRTLKPQDNADFLYFIVSLLMFGTVLVCPSTVHAFDLNDIAQRAEQLASVSFKSSNTDLPKELEKLDYDKYRDIRFKPEKAMWKNFTLPFEITFFPQGWNYNQPVKINEISPQGVREIKLDPDNFDYGANKIDPKQLVGLRFSGFRVHFPVNTAQYKDEILVFLGASYFRALGKGQHYGLSARGLAVDTASSSGEEFPRFVEFWLQRPEPDAKELIIYGLLDSQRITGAYQFVIKPGISTTVDISARIFPREVVGKLGIAPLTSMMSFGENQHSSSDDYRPEVHDSDGLSIHTSNDEWIWRPLVNPRRLLVTSFSTTNPLGFGLMQRDRDFGHYEDMEAHYEARPSAWIEPKGSWGAGRVELVQIPAPDETNDNIVAYWVADAPLKPRVSYNFEYRISWQKDQETRPPLSWVVQTRRGRGFTRHPDGSIGLLVDFDGPELSKLNANERLEGVVSVDGNGQLIENTLYHNDITGVWRLSLRVKRISNDKPIEIRSFLRSANNTLSETWSYILPPD